MADSGVRSSWLSVARNWSFITLADSAASLARSITSSACRRAVSSRSLDEPARRLAFGAGQQRQHAAAPEPGAVLAEVPALVLGPPVAAGLGLLLLGRARRPVLRRVNHHPRLPDRLLLGVPGDQLRAGVPGGDAVRRVEHDHREIAGPLDDVAELLLALAHRLQPAALVVHVGGASVPGGDPPGPVAHRPRLH